MPILTGLVNVEKEAVTFTAVPCTSLWGPVMWPVDLGGLSTVVQGS